MNTKANKRREQTAHALNRLNTHVFNIQPLFLVEAVPMFNTGMQAPIVIHLLDNAEIFKENIHDQNQLAVQGEVIRHKDAQRCL